MFFRTYKNVTLQERYPNICEKLFRNETHICQRKHPPAGVRHSDYSNGEENDDASGDEEEESYLLEEQENSLINDP